VQREAGWRVFYVMVRQSNPSQPCSDKESNMKMAKTMMSLLLLSAACVTPASASWFSNPRTNTMLNIGSAPNPTPADLRAIDDSRGATGPALGRNDSAVSIVPEQTAYVTTNNDTHVMTSAELSRMEGKTVFGARGARLGPILTINLDLGMAEVQTPGGIAVAMPASLLLDKGNRVVAPTVSPLDMMAMAKAQTGRTVAINIDPNHLVSRTPG
jgi:hypothetical protein